MTNVKRLSPFEWDAREERKKKGKESRKEGGMKGGKKEGRDEEERWR